MSTLDESATYLSILNSFHDHMLEFQEYLMNEMMTDNTRSSYFNLVKSMLKQKDIRDNSVFEELLLKDYAISSHGSRMSARRHYLKFLGVQDPGSRKILDTATVTDPRVIAAKNIRNNLKKAMMQFIASKEQGFQEEYDVNLLYIMVEERYHEAIRRRLEMQAFRDKEREISVNLPKNLRKNIEEASDQELDDLIDSLHKSIDEKEKHEPSSTE